MCDPETKDTSEPTLRNEIELGVPSGYPRIRLILYIMFVIYLVLPIVAVTRLFREDSSSDAEGYEALGGALVFCLVIGILIYGWRRASRWSLVAVAILGGGLTIAMAVLIVSGIVGLVVAGQPGIEVIGGWVVGLVLWLAIVGAYVFQPSLYRFVWKIAGKCPLCKQEQFKGRIAINRSWSCPRCSGSVVWIREVE